MGKITMHVKKEKKCKNKETGVQAVSRGGAESKKRIGL